MFFGCCFHVGSVALKKVNHFYISVESCEVESCNSFLIGYIDPCSELIFEGRVLAMMFEIFPGECLEVQNVDLHLRQFIFEGGEVQ